MRRKLGHVERLQRMIAFGSPGGFGGLLSRFREDLARTCPSRGTVSSSFLRSCETVALPHGRGVASIDSRDGLDAGRPSNCVLSQCNSAADRA